MSVARTSDDIFISVTTECRVSRAISKLDVDAAAVPAVHGEMVMTHGSATRKPTAKPTAKVLGNESVIRAESRGHSAQRRRNPCLR